MFIKGQHIYLRALEPSDLAILYCYENDTKIWNISNTQTPFSKHVLNLYLNTSHQDIYTNKQLRLMICTTKQQTPVGTIDLFDFEPSHNRVGVGILIFEDYRKQGFALEAINLLKTYCFNLLLINQLFCNISISNTQSIQLFQKCNFTKIGVKKQWNKISINGYEDEILYQCINN